MKKAFEILREAAETYEERNKVYGDNYIKVGGVMEALFPDGLTLKTADDWNRMHIFILGVVKQTRYVTSWNSGGHRDSCRDNTVYSAMLEEIDTEIENRKPNVYEKSLLEDFAQSIREGLIEEGVLSSALRMVDGIVERSLAKRYGEENDA